MSLPSTKATLRDCQQFVGAVQAAQGRVPAVRRTSCLAGPF